MNHCILQVNDYRLCIKPYGETGYPWSVFKVEAFISGWDEEVCSFSDALQAATRAYWRAAIKDAISAVPGSQFVPLASDEGPWFNPHFRFVLGTLMTARTFVCGHEIHVVGAYDNGMTKYRDFDYKMIDILKFDQGMPGNVLSH